jgi:TIR domain
MPEAGSSYRAFLSYSHRDRKWGDWLHRRLEGWPVPRDLVGQRRPPGPGPAKLRPIFRDRSDMEAGQSLREQVVAALGASEALIVLCSPHSAQSAYVNEEIRQFKARGKSNRVLPIIVGGIPGDPEQDCFPDALRRRVAADGSSTDQIDEPLAADARDEGDGRALALLKIIAGLIGVDLDEIRKREAIELRRRHRRLFWVAGVMTVLAIAAGTSTAVAIQQRNAATAAQHDAERRYDQALDTTLRLVTTSATFRSLLDGRPFSTEQIDAKGESSDFQEFLHSARNPDDVWFRLAKVLLAYEQSPPAELRNLRSRLEATKMRLQWAQHADRILRNRAGGFETEPDYPHVRAELDAAIARLEHGSGPL